MIFSWTPVDCPTNKISVYRGASGSCETLTPRPGSVGKLLFTLSCFFFSFFLSSFVGGSRQKTEDPQPTALRFWLGGALADCEDPAATRQHFRGGHPLFAGARGIA